MGRVRGSIRGGFLLVLVLVAGVGRASASPALSATGTVEGALKTGDTLTVRLVIVHRLGWQHIQEIDINLELRNRSLDLLRFTPPLSTVEILGYPPPARLGQPGIVAGSYLDVAPSKVSLSAGGTTLRITAPMKFLVDPPAGARLTFAATDDQGASTGFRALTPPVKSSSGFSWGTLGLAIAVALFAGAFVGNLVTSRRRPAPRPSIYGAVQRRLDEERTRT
jgi:hypothetical protein